MSEPSSPGPPSSGDMTAGGFVTSMGGFPGRVHCVLTVGATVWCGSAQGCILVHDSRTFEYLRTVRCAASDNVTSLALVQGYVWAGCSGGEVAVFNPQTGRCITELLGHAAQVCSLSVADCETKVFSGSGDGTVREFDAATGDLRRVLRGHQGWVRAVLCVTDRTVWSAGDDHIVRVWRSDTGALETELRGHSAAVYALVRVGSGFGPANGANGRVPSQPAVVREVWSGSADQTLRSWDADAARPLRQLRGPRGWICSLLCVPASALAPPAAATGVGATLAHRCYVWSGSADRMVRIWDARSGECVREVRGHRGWVVGLALVGENVWSSSGDGSVRVWRARQPNDVPRPVPPRPKSSLPPPTTAAANVRPPRVAPAVSSPGDLRGAAAGRTRSDVSRSLNFSTGDDADSNGRLPSPPVRSHLQQENWHLNKELTKQRQTTERMEALQEEQWQERCQLERELFELRRLLGVNTPVPTPKPRAPSASESVGSRHAAAAAGATSDEPSHSLSPFPTRSNVESGASAPVAKLPNGFPGHSPSTAPSKTRATSTPGPRLQEQQRLLAQYQIAGELDADALSALTWLDSAVQQTSKELASTRDRLWTEQSRATELATVRVPALEEQVAQQRADLAAQQAESAQALAELRAACAQELAERTANLTGEVRQLTRRLDEAGVAQRTADQTIERLREQLATAERRLADVSVQNGALSSVAEKLRTLVSRSHAEDQAELERRAALGDRRHQELAAETAAHVAAAASASADAERRVAQTPALVTRVAGSPQPTWSKSPTVGLRPSQPSPAVSALTQIALEELRERSTIRRRPAFRDGREPLSLSSSSSSPPPPPLPPATLGRDAEMHGGGGGLFSSSAFTGDHSGNDGDPTSWLGELEKARNRAANQLEDAKKLANLI